LLGNVRTSYDASGEGGKGRLLKPSESRHMGEGVFGQIVTKTFTAAEKVNLQFLLLYLRYMGKVVGWKHHNGGLVHWLKISEYRRHCGGSRSKIATKIVIWYLNVPLLLWISCFTSIISARGFEQAASTLTGKKSKKSIRKVGKMKYQLLSSMVRIRPKLAPTSFSRDSGVTKKTIGLPRIMWLVA